MKYDYYPLICSGCKRIGHTVDKYHVVPNANRVVSNPRRENSSVDANSCWQVLRRRERQQRVPSVHTRTEGRGHDNNGIKEGSVGLLLLGRESNNKRSWPPGINTFDSQV